MPRTAQLDVIPLHRAINKYFDLSIYLLVLMGFATLASTGALDLPTITLVGLALALRGYVLAKQRPVAIPERLTTPLTLAYFLFYGADYFLFSRSFLNATVHLVLFAVVIRMFSLRRDRDSVTLAILAFLMVLASAVLTVDSVFLFFFAAFMLVAVGAFLLRELKSSEAEAKFRARHSRDPQEHRHLAFSLARMTPGLAILILTGAAGLFFVLPRMSTGYLGAYSFGTDFSTGFSDRVQLGGIGQIQQSDAVVMHIAIDGDKAGAHFLHWRGVALENFDGRNWSNPRERWQKYPLPREADGSFAVPLVDRGTPGRTPSERAEGRGNGSGASFIHYRVMMEPIGTNVFFLAPWGRRISGAYRGVEADSRGAVTNLDIQRPVSLYEAESDLAIPDAGQLRAAGDFLPANVFDDLQLPPRLDARIAPLAARVTASAFNSYDKAEMLEKYLKSTYAYTLQLPRTAPADPLANFLFERRQGHCEYFATSMAMMLRTLRIPARVVTGFTSGEFNSVTGNYVVRARNAHAWVEAYFPGYGWITFDPTPPAGVMPQQNSSLAMLYLDAASSFWREWVISYDSSHQFVLGQTLMSGTRSSWERAHWWSELRYARLLSWARQKQASVVRKPGLSLGWAIAAVLLLGGLTNLRRILRFIRERGLRAHPERAPEQVASLWYEKLMKLLRRRGLRKAAGQTAQEFVRIIPHEDLRKKVRSFSDAYEAARFGNSPDEARRLAELYEDVEIAAKK